MDNMFSNHTSEQMKEHIIYHHSELMQTRYIWIFFTVHLFFFVLLNSGRYHHYIPQTFKNIPNFYDLKNKMTGFGLLYNFTIAIWENGAVFPCWMFLSLTLVFPMMIHLFHVLMTLEPTMKSTPKDIDLEQAKKKSPKIKISEIDVNSRGSVITFVGILIGILTAGLVIYLKIKSGEEINNLFGDCGIHNQAILWFMVGLFEIIFEVIALSCICLLMKKRIKISCMFYFSNILFSIASCLCLVSIIAIQTNKAIIEKNYQIFQYVNVVYLSMIYSILPLFFFSIPFSINIWFSDIKNEIQQTKVISRQLKGINAKIGGTIEMENPIISSSENVEVKQNCFIKIINVLFCFCAPRVENTYYNEISHDDYDFVDNVELDDSDADGQTDLELIDSRNTKNKKKIKEEEEEEEEEEELGKVSSNKNGNGKMNGEDEHTWSS